MRTKRSTWSMLALSAASALCASAAAPALIPPVNPPGRPPIQPPGRPQPPGQPGSPPMSPIRPPGSRDESGNALVQARMISDVARIKPGSKFHLAFVFDIEKDWHIYWQNAGSSGAPTTIDVKAPPNFAVSRTLFPRPQAIDTPEGVVYGYEGQTVLLVEVTAPPSAMPQIGFNADASWLVCKEVCKMGSSRLTLMLPFGASALPGGSEEPIDPVIAEYKSRLPKQLKDVATSEVSFDGSTLFVSVPAARHDDAEFFPADTPGVEYGEPVVKKMGDHIHMNVSIKVDASNALGKPMRIAGLIGLGRSQTDPCYEFEIPLTADGRPRSD